MKLPTVFLTGSTACVLVVACSSAPELAPLGEPADGGGAIVSPSPDAGLLDVWHPALDSGIPSPLEVACAGDPCYVAVSGNHSRHVCGLLRDGSVRCWGRDSMPAAAASDDDILTMSDGALGRGGAISVLEGATPAPVVGLADVTQISVGPNLGTCARTQDGSVHCWGRNDYGQLGRPISEPRVPVAARVEGIPPVDTIALGARIGCAIASADRSLHCWGKRIDGLGLDAGDGDTFEARHVTTIPAPVKAIVIGMWEEEDTVIALLPDNTLATAGGAASGETSLMPPFESPLERFGVARSWTFAYVTTDGLLRRWRPADDTVYIPSLAPVVDVKIGGGSQGEQGGALLSTGRLFRWGDNSTGALGVSPSHLLVGPHPVEVTQVEANVVSFATTIDSTCASLVDGSVVCWGGNRFGELGRGTVDSSPHPEAASIR